VPSNHVEACPGREILHPIKIVISSGSSPTTQLDLTVRPLVFWELGLNAAEKHLKT